MSPNKTIFRLGLLLLILLIALLYLATHATASKVAETLFLIGIILSPVSFILSLIALWVAWKNRQKAYEIK